MMYHFPVVNVKLQRFIIQCLQTLKAIMLSNSSSNISVLFVQTAHMKFVCSGNDWLTSKSDFGTVLIRYF